MRTVCGKYFGEIDFTGRIIKTTVVNGKIIHDVILNNPITHFGDTRYQVLVRNEDLLIDEDSVINF